jgi:signal transduction protein with GAF and PtsI domain
MKKKSTKNLIKELAKKNKELKIIFRLVRDIASLEMGKILKKIVVFVNEITKADSCFIYVLDPKKGELVLRASKNPHKTLLKKIKMKMGEGITGWVAKEQKPVAISKDAYNDIRFKYFKSLPEDRYQAFLSVPIINNKGVVGVINIQHKNIHRASKEEIELLMAIGRIVGGAIENARLVEESLELKDALETRKILEKAKGILMKNLKISEEEVYQKIRTQSMNSGKSIREISEAIILSEKLLR